MRALEIGAGEHDEQRRAVHAAVVAAERNFAEFGHLAVAHFVQDLAGLGIGLGVDVAVAWVAARNFSTPRAIAGSSQSA